MAMRRYLRLGGDSGVVAYAIHPQSIDVEFVDGRVYTYSYASADRERIEQMKLLAKAGKGLSTYISKYVHADYACCTQAGKTTRKQQPPS
jgi:hypothetical protein